MIASISLAVVCVECHHPSMQECVAAYCRNIVSELSVEASSMHIICNSPID